MLRRDFKMYIASEKRYDAMKYNRCGNSGLLLPEVSLGLWHNFGSKELTCWDFPGGPGAKTPCSQCRGPGFDFWSGN